MTNQELVFEKLFPTSAGSEKMNSELRQSYERIKENRAKILRQLPPSYALLSEINLIAPITVPK